MKKTSLIAVNILTFLMLSCQGSENQLTQYQKQEIIASASEVVKKVFDHSNNLNFVKGLDHYSGAPDSYYITDGVLHSLDDLKQQYREIGPSVERLHNTIQSWNAQVISKDVVNFVLPVNLKLKLKGIPEFEGQLVWTATVQKQKNEWMIVQSHESWLNCAEVAEAFSPANDKDDK